MQRANCRSYLLRAAFGHGTQCILFSLTSKAAMRFRENRCKMPRCSKMFVSQLPLHHGVEVMKVTFEGNPTSLVCVTFRASWCAGTFRFLREIFLECPVGGCPSILFLGSSVSLPLPLGSILSLPAHTAALTARRRVSTSHLVADSLFQSALYSFKSLFESLNSSHFGFSKTNMDKNTQRPLSMMDPGDR